MPAIKACLLNILLQIYLLQLKAKDFSPYTLPGKTANQSVLFIY